MNDICCPECGHKFLGRECWFDLTNHIAATLFNISLGDEIEVSQDSVRFKFFVNEDEIIDSNPAENPKKIRCTANEGPRDSRECFKFNISYKYLYNYILMESGLDKEICVKVMRFLSELAEKDFSDEILRDVPEATLFLNNLFFFPSARMPEKLNFNDQNVKIAVRIIANILKNQKSDEDLLTLYVQTQCCINLASDGNNDRIPDRLFLCNESGRVERIQKCCKYCNSKLPSEFGHYKMRTVVLWGEQSSGKSSFLVSMLGAITGNYVKPFDNFKYRIKILNDDVWYDKHFKKNLELFHHNYAPIKTDYNSVPILNLLVGETIYSFIDWPGEAFIMDTGTIGGESTRGREFMYNIRPIAHKANHILFFVPPSHIVNCNNIQIDDLLRALSNHLGEVNINRLKSLFFIANKADSIPGCDGTHIVKDAVELRDYIAEKSVGIEETLYNSGKWNEGLLKEIQEKVRRYYSGCFGNLYMGLENISINGVQEGKDTFRKYYIPVKPYGYEAKKKDDIDSETGGNQEGSAAFQAVPFLIILREDGLI